MQVSDEHLVKYVKDIKFVDFLRKISKDDDVKLSHMLAGMIENGFLKKYTPFSRYYKLVKEFDIKVGIDHGYVAYIEDNLTFEEFISILKNNSPTFAIYAFLCANIFYDIERIFALTVNDSLDIIGEFKSPCWLTIILNRLKETQVEYGEEFLFLSSGTSKSQFIQNVRQVKKRILLMYEVDYDKFISTYYKSKFVVKRKIRKKKVGDFVKVGKNFYTIVDKWHNDGLFTIKDKHGKKYLMPDYLMEYKWNTKRLL